MTEVAEVATTSILTSRTYITPPTTRLRGEACCYALAGVLPGVGLLIRGTRVVAFAGTLHRELFRRNTVRRR
jgi:hypothetical protein